MHEILEISNTLKMLPCSTMEFEKGCDAQTEILLLEDDEVKESEEDAVVLEARMIATRFMR